MYMSRMKVLTIVALAFLATTGVSVANASYRIPSKVERNNGAPFIKTTHVSHGTYR